MSMLGTSRCCCCFFQFMRLVHLLLVYLVTAFVPSLTACFASSPGSKSLIAVWISLELMVLWCSGKKSWLKESNLPLSVKECRKSGTVFEQRLVMQDELGQKRMEYQFSTSTGIQGGKVQSGEGVSSSGFAVEVVEDNVIVDDRGQQRTMTCETEKSKHKAKNHRTAGIFAIAKPCSIVVEVKELFGSESKTQVYAHLHELLQKPSMHSIE
ncbi:uncharacterized protein LOC141894790 isoform X6 [Acropora palmata]